jgi:membrane protein implicated in regulation of membrane protease activity
MFATKYWLKETLVVIFLVAVVGILVALFIPFPYSFPVSVGIVILIVWLIHRRTKNVRTSDV